MIMKAIDPTYVDVDHAWMDGSNRNPFEVRVEGRTTRLVAGASLILSGRFTPDEVVKYLREKRSEAVLCNQSFEKFLLDFDVTPV